MIPKESLHKLSLELEGELFFDELHKAIYATDASVFRQKPLAVALPKSKDDIRKLIHFATQNKTSLIPRTAGTSLAGQVVGDGIVVDVSKHFTKILGFDEKRQIVTIEPGVIRDELNAFLKPYGYFFAPNTSTANRCMLGGMVGNNSSGTTSIKYGVTRDKVLEIEALLSDGTEVVFKELSLAEFDQKLVQNTLEGQIYRCLKNELSAAEVQKRIKDTYPKPEIHRRNNGYAIDELINQKPFNPNGNNLNLCALLTGSEGTLAFTTKLTLKVDKLPPANNVMVAAHFKSVADACKAVVPVMQHGLYTCEMMDKTILDCTKNNKGQAPNRFFIEGDPEAILMLELAHEDPSVLEAERIKLIETLEKSGLSYAYPSLYGEDIDKSLELRKAGLGLLGNIVGDNKSAPCIEDTAVAIEDLANYIDEFSALMASYGQKAIYYAHAGAGELHLRPIVNLKKSEGVAFFRTITTEVAKLVKKYRGSMSGEHGDGRVRSEFIEMMIGAENMKVLEKIKNAFDPQNIFNPGKIVNPVPMDAFLRYEKDRKEPEIATKMDFSDTLGILRAAEQCNGSGDCRKTHLSGGVMCPSYHATKNEKDTTRARANVLREFLTNSEDKNRFNHQEIKEAFDLCISCKGCSSECPSNVDIATMKTEFLYQYQKANGSSLRDKAFARSSSLNRMVSKFSFLVNNPVSVLATKKVLGIAKERSLPKVSSFNFDKYLHSIKNQKSKNSNSNNSKLLLFIDEFTRYNDIEVGKDAIFLLNALGYSIELFYSESGRTYLSKGFLDEAQHLANKNINSLSKKISAEVPLVGLEPSAILSFRDEYLRLVDRKEEAKKIAKHSFLIEEFLSEEIKKGKITKSQFTKQPKQVKIHGHCHQKALSNQKVTFDVLNLPENYSVSIFSTGCCGMAGSFGYEKEHYSVSMQIGELKLFPAIRKTDKDIVIAANGTSCRHQIFDGTKRIAKHPVSILKESLL